MFSLMNIRDVSPRLSFKALTPLVSTVLVPAMAHREGSSYPHWTEFILDRLDYHRLHQQTAKDLDDYDSVDQHAVVIEELKHILDCLGADVYDN
jgi:hypothetical protein